MYSTVVMVLVPSHNTQTFVSRNRLKRFTLSERIDDGTEQLRRIILRQTSSICYALEWLSAFHA